MFLALRHHAAESRRTLPDYVRVVLAGHLERLGEEGRKVESTGREAGTSMGEKAAVLLAAMPAAEMAACSESPSAHINAEELATLRRSIETAVQHADQTACHAFSAFAEWFDYFAAVHDEEKVREAIQGLNLPRCAVPGGEWEDWEDLLHRGRKLAENLASQRVTNQS